MTDFVLTGWLCDWIETCIRVFGNIYWNNQREAATSQGIMNLIASFMTEKLHVSLKMFWKNHSLEMFHANTRNIRQYIHCWISTRKSNTTSIYTWSCLTSKREKTNSIQHYSHPNLGLIGRGFPSQWWKQTLRNRTLLYQPHIKFFYDKHDNKSSIPKQSLRKFILSYNFI
jgi:hypothetical protein